MKKIIIILLLLSCLSCSHMQKMSDVPFIPGDSDDTSISIIERIFDLGLFIWSFSTHK